MRPALWLALAVLGCKSAPEGMVTLRSEPAAAPALGDEPPVPLNSRSPAAYPPALAEQRIGGTVVLRLFVNEAGAVVADSTEVKESSGYPALDSAALAAAPKLRYAPALREGRPVATQFLQPFNFRAPPGGGQTP